jgi:hypothetical protein
MRDPDAAGQESEAAMLQIMLRMKLVLIAALVALFGASIFTPASAQTAPPRYPRPRIVITPQPPLYRRCVERLEVQYRPSGAVLFPLTYCWWVRG